MKPGDKLYLDAQQLMEDSFRLAAMAFNSGFRPTTIVAVWRGGAPIGLAVQEFYSAAGLTTDHIAIRTSSYHGIDQQQSQVAVHGLSYLVKNLTAADRLLIVDDVFDTGRSIQAIITTLQQKLRRNMPEQTKIAVPYYKPTRNQTSLVPDYYLHETEQWLKFPYSLEGLTHEEIKTHRPEIYAVLEKYLAKQQNVETD